MQGLFEIRAYMAPFEDWNLCHVSTTQSNHANHGPACPAVRQTLSTFSAGPIAHMTNLVLDDNNPTNVIRKTREYLQLHWQDNPLVDVVDKVRIHCTPESSRYHLSFASSLLAGRFHHKSSRRREQAFTYTNVPASLKCLQQLPGSCSA